MRIEHILFLEDEPTIAEVAKEYMSLQNYQVTWIDTKGAALAQLGKQKFDLAILDIMVPDGSGLEVLEEIRKNVPTLPVIMLSALGDETTQLQAFNLYADDYIIKPFSPLLLLKRIEVLLRRTRTTATTSLNVSKKTLVINENLYQVFYNDESLYLTLTEFLLIQTLARNPQQVFTRSQLLDYLFADDYFPNDRIIDAHIKNVRKKLPIEYIKTIIGVGYQFSGSATIIELEVKNNVNY